MPRARQVTSRRSRDEERLTDQKEHPMARTPGSAADEPAETPPATNETAETAVIPPTPTAQTSYAPPPGQPAAPPPASPAVQTVHITRPPRGLVLAGIIVAAVLVLGGVFSGGVLVGTLVNHDPHLRISVMHVPPGARDRVEGPRGGQGGKLGTRDGGGQRQPGGNGDDQGGNGGDQQGGSGSDD
jgi:hypothetical protein